MKNRFILFFLFLVLGLPTMAMADSQSVVINEIVWMGTTASANDEWIELYNNTQNDPDLDGWVLKAGDGTPEINLTGIIPGLGFYLLERTDDSTVPEITADLIYKGALGNNGESLKLFDDSGNIIDEVDCSAGWFTGDNSTKQTMERISSSAPGGDVQNWQTSQNPGGTPKAKNSLLSPEKPMEEPVEVRPPLQTPLPTPPPAAEPAEAGSPLIYPTGIVFNEILPSPEGADETEERIEIFNQNSFEVDISGWKIKDKIGKITIYTIPDRTKVSPLGFLVFSRPETKITLNNSGDGLNLFYPNEEIADSIDFGKAPLGQSYNKTQSGWVWSTILTPGAENIVVVVAKSPEPSFAPFSGASEGKGTAALEKKLPESFSSFGSSKKLFTILIAAIIAVFSAIIIFLLKKLNTASANQPD